MKLKIGVMGSASGYLHKGHLDAAYRLGRAIAGNDCVTITGACPGLPLEAARGAKDAGGLVIGVSPALSEWEHVHRYDSPVDYHDVLIFTGSGLMGREVVNIRTSDIVVIIGGRSGTLGEFSIAYDEGKLVGVVLGTGGITSEIKYILRVIKKKTGARVLHDDDPERLVKSLLSYYTSRHFRRPSVHTHFVVQNNNGEGAAEGSATPATGGEGSV
ncbi:MAG: protein containing YHS domain protein [Nitrospiraceae bacterium]|nr:protein containing YHS domain protein [Nitrospiraceae bacterium]